MPNVVRNPSMMDALPPRSVPPCPEPLASESSAPASAASRAASSACGSREGLKPREGMMESSALARAKRNTVCVGATVVMAPPTSGPTTTARLEAVDMSELMCLSCTGSSVM